MRRLITLTLSLLLLLPACLFGQSTVRGVVVDSLTQEPLASATVYVNGTTQGTSTDADGRFELKDVMFPATVVFSFVGYQTQAMDLTRNPGELRIRLKTNDVLPEVVVSGKANKIDKKELEFFRKMFLGDDKWGKRATIKNENVILIDIFRRTSYYTRQIVKASYASRTVHHDAVEKREVYTDTVKVNKSVFRAWASEPLIIDLPQLGYELYVDLIKFNVEQTNIVTQYDMLGYFYYKPYDNVSKRQAKSIEENRMRAYYGSSQHFLKSFADNRLTENGYTLTKSETIVKDKKSITTNLPVDVSEYSESKENLIQIHGLKDKNLKIRYYHRSDGSPVSFSETGKGIRRYSESGITFLEDDCSFSKEGIVRDNSIRFTGDISKRRVASSLPDDYLPPGDSIRIRTVESVDYASELMKFADNINQFNSMFPQEKVYLEFDNTAYFQGENIWFKAFVTNATTLERAPSGVLYVDFLAPTGKLILQQKLKIEEGQTDGAIPLLDAGTFQTREKQGILAYPSGFYEIRAYTQNMLDFSPEAIFSRVIPVYTQPKYQGEYDRSHVVRHDNSPYSEDLRNEHKRQWQKEQDKAVNVTFYPEGGDWVRGLPCRVAFKATGSDAFGLEGTLVISGGPDSVHTAHDGMGAFIVNTGGFRWADFYPTGSDERYYFNLPDPQESGYSMISDMLSDSLLQVNIWRTPDRIGEQTALAVTCRGDVIHFEEIKDVENSQLKIDCSGWPVGVCRVTLYNKEGGVLSSRSIFHGSGNPCGPTIAVYTDSLSHQSCDKEVLEFMLTDESGNPFRDRFCLSVRDATDYGGGRTDNLQSNLLLSSDLRGYIHDPAWYLEADDEEHREALNLLTLVQGWERYEWQTMTGLTEFEEKHRVEEGLTMNGWILSYSRRDPVSDIGVYANVIPDDDKTLFEGFEYITDSTGYFGFDLSDFYGKGKFNINLMSTNENGVSKNEKSKRIRFERADRPKPRPYFKQETDLNHNDHRPYDYKVDYTDYDLTPAQRRKLGRMIDDVDIEEAAEKQRFVDFDTFTSFEVEEDAELELDQGEYTTDLEGYFLERGIRFNYESTEDKLLEEEMDMLSGVSMSDEGGESENEGGLDIGFENKYESGTSSGLMSDNDNGNDNGLFIEKEIVPHFYVHNLQKFFGVPGPFANPLKIDMIDIKSIILFDRPMYPREFADIIPLEIEYARKRADTDFMWWLSSSMRRYYLVDVQIKEDRQLLFDWEIRNLGRRTTTVKGFTRPVQYYSPVYPDGPIEGTPDYRRTLYWNPNVITDEDGHARVEFYNNSFTRKFTINAAGITASGVPYILNQNW